MNPTLVNFVDMKGFSIVHLNVRSLLKHKDESFLYLRGCDIICYSESWLTDRAGDALLSYEGYKYIRQDRPGGKRGGGLIIYVKEMLFPYITILSDLCPKDGISEEIWCMLAKPGWKRCIIGLIYRPPSGNADIFNMRLKETLQVLHENNNFLELDVLMLGDFNINYARTKNPARTNLTTLTKYQGLYQLIKRPTRVTNKTKSILDLIFTNISHELINSSGVIEIAISDHMPIYLNKKAKRNKHPKSVIMTRNYSNYSKEIFRNTLFDNNGWVDFWSTYRDPNRLWSILSSIIIQSVDALCPIKRKVIRSDQNPWVDKTLRQSLYAKVKQYKKALVTNTDDDWTLYREMKVNTRRLLTSKKREYIHAKLEENRDDPRLFWQEMDKSLRVGKSKSSKICDRIKGKDGTVVTGSEVLTQFNEFYVSIGHDLAKKFPTTGPYVRVQIDLHKQCVFRFVGIKEVISVIKSLKNNKSTCLGYINMKILKEALNILIVEFTHLINECLDLCVMPDEWKVGTVSPLRVPPH